MIYFILALLMAVMSGVMTLRIITPIICFFFTLIASYLSLPVIGFGFAGIPSIILANMLIASGIESIVYMIRSDMGYRKYKPNKLTFSWVATCIYVLVFITLAFITTSSVFHHQKYRDIIGEVETSTFSTDTSLIDPTQVRIVDKYLARRLAEKRIGEDPGLGSQVDLGNMYIQVVDGHLYWVGCLRHNGFGRWLNNEGTPGYIRVSATDMRDAEMVTKINGQPLVIRYNKGAFFGDKPERYLYANGYASTPYDDWTFEINDEGKPFYVVTRYEKLVGFSGRRATGVIILDVQNGDITEYDIENTPEWVDRIQPIDVVTEQLDNWGYYVHGWWLQNWSNKDRLKTTKGMSLIYGQNGESFWYTGLSSIGQDDSTVGFTLTNTRTGQTRFYQQAGATETSAMSSARGAVQEKGYGATSPIMYNVSGQPTYFTTLKDQEGLVKMVAFVSVENYQIVGVDTTVKSALNRYRRALNSQGNAFAADTSIDQRVASDLVERIGVELKSGESFYYIVLNNFENKQFVVSSDISPEIINTQVSDHVVVHFDDTGNGPIYVSYFDNTELDFQVSDDQHIVNQRVEQVRTDQAEKRTDQNLDAQWENLSPDEKRALMEQ